MEVTERDRQIETLLAQVEADKVGVILDILAIVDTIPKSDTFSYQHDKLAGVVWTPINVWLFTVEIYAAHRSKNRAKITVLCVNRSRIQYGFPAGAKAIPGFYLGYLRGRSLPPKMPKFPPKDIVIDTVYK